MNFPDLLINALNGMGSSYMMGSLYTKRNVLKSINSQNISSAYLVIFLNPSDVVSGV